MKIAILHEMLIKLGGAEKVVEKFMSIFPEADIFTLIYDENKVGKVFPKEKVRVASITQRIYKITKNQRLCLLYMARAVESLDFSDYDVVLCSSSGFAHGAITKPETKFIVYYHSPTRYLWDWTNEYKKDIGWNSGIKGYILNSIFLKLRIWDVIASARVDINLANSINSASRVKKYYRKDSEILYPPIETKRFSKQIEKPNCHCECNEAIQKTGNHCHCECNEAIQKTGNHCHCECNEAIQKTGNNIVNGLLRTPVPVVVSQGQLATTPLSEGQFNYYIIISALTEFKKIDIAIEGFNKMPDKNLVIIGDGNYKETLKSKIKGTNIIFTGAKYSDELVELVQGSKGLVFPGEEDFGIVPIEAMAAGKPIFAYAGGGLLETVIEDKTGNFFQDKTGYDFVPKFQEFDQKINSGFFNQEFIINHALNFDEALFEKRIKEIVYGK